MFKKLIWLLFSLQSFLLMLSCSDSGNEEKLAKKIFCGREFFIEKNNAQYFSKYAINFPFYKIQGYTFVKGDTIYLTNKLDIDCKNVITYPIGIKRAEPYKAYKVTGIKINYLENKPIKYFYSYYIIYNGKSNLSGTECYVFTTFLNVCDHACCKSQDVSNSNMIDKKVFYIDTNSDKIVSFLYYPSRTWIVNLPF